MKNRRLVLSLCLVLAMAASALFIACHFPGKAAGQLDAPAGQPASLLVPLITKVNGQNTTTPTPLTPDVFYLNTKQLVIEGTATPPPGMKAQVQIIGASGLPVGSPVDVKDGGAWNAKFTVSDPTDYEFRATIAPSNGSPDNRSAPVDVSVRLDGPQVVNVSPLDFGFTPNSTTITIQFTPGRRMDPSSAKDRNNYVFENTTEGASSKTVTPATDPVFDPRNNTVILQPGPLQPGTYKLTVKQTLIDIYKNSLGQSTTDPTGKAFTAALVMPIGADLPLVAPGISAPTGPFVPYPEFTKPRNVPDGFNPADKVDTRVVRLYYYRDAHRVAQVVNRDARSWNRVAVDVRRRMAEQARSVAEQATIARQARERAAIQAAKESREAERDYAQAQAKVSQLEPQEANSKLEINQLTPFKNQNLGVVNGVNQDAARDTRLAVASQTLADLDAARNQARDAYNRIQASRKQEVEQTEASQAAQAEEDRDRAQQFRLEVAAAHEDPDTYAPGVPDSDDPVRQVSVSVIGDAMIQLRGPMKGVNVIRRMINQMDQPAGQVRVAIHTVQINGEHGDRMEKVACRIQDYIDHSRFLTVQSSLMLRKAVVLVASRKAEAAAQQCPGDTQEAHDLRYLYAFFGKDFTDELRAMDSEFLHTGNKLLSLHSMDTTSLSSALFLLALAKNTTRQEILTEFQRMLTDELPVAEQSYFEAGGDRQCGKCEKFQLFSQNARYQSFLGFFNGEIAGADTISPLQREFIRLAQIFKSQMITEMEWNQRVMERAMIEQRQGTYQTDLAKQKAKEDKANDAFATLEQLRGSQQSDLFGALANLAAEAEKTLRDESNVGAEFRSFEDELTQQRNLRIDLVSQNADQSDAPPNDTMKKQADELKRQPLSLNSMAETADLLRMAAMQIDNKSTKPEDIRRKQEYAAAITAVETVEWNLSSTKIKFARVDMTNKWGLDADSLANWKAIVKRAKDSADRFEAKFEIHDPVKTVLENARKKLIALDQLPNQFDSTIINPLMMLKDVYRAFDYVASHINGQIQSINHQIEQLVADISLPNSDLNADYRKWITLRDFIASKIKGDLLNKTALPLFDTLDKSFLKTLETDLRVRLAQQDAEKSRRPLDQRKLLDMLIDEVEDKYIDLLEGTRAHTANIDDYLKRLATALEDDVNTQFYYPSFREVRQASRMWDVTLGDIETTSILTNNRMFAKVDPQATMEFDLPHRDILINEAMTDAKALIDQYGALTQDPTFLSLVKMKAGQPTAMMAQGSSGGDSLVRNVLPGLPRSGDEQLVTQRQQQNRQLTAPLEALIPDPAIYKFETGTGYEISPVIEPDGQSVVFHFNYMYSTNVREPVRADEKHLGRIKRHYIDTEVQLGNYELREISRYQVALKASRTSRGVPGLEDIPGVGVLFRPLPSAESSLQENIVLGQATIYPTLFDLMGLRWAPAVADLDPLSLQNAEFVVRNRRRDLMNRVFDFSTSKVDEFIRVPPAERRTDLYRTQETIPYVHPNGYQGPGLNLRDSQMREGYDPRSVYPESQYIPRSNPEDSPPVRGVPAPYIQGAPLAPGASYPSVPMLPKPKEETQFIPPDPKQVSGAPAPIQRPAVAVNPRPYQAPTQNGPNLTPPPPAINPRPALTEAGPLVPLPGGSQVPQSAQPLPPAPAPDPRANPGAPPYPYGK